MSKVTRLTICSSLLLLSLVAFNHADAATVSDVPNGQEISQYFSNLKNYFEPQEEKTEALKTVQEENQKNDEEWPLRESYNSRTRILENGQRQAEFHGKWVNYLNENDQWQEIRPKFMKTEKGFEMTEAPFEVIVPFYSDEPAVFNNNNRYNVETGEIIYDQPLEQTIQALNISKVPGEIQKGDLGWGETQYVIYPKAYTDQNADLIYWVHQGTQPRLRKFIRFNESLQKDTDFQFKIIFSDEVKIENTGENVIVSLNGSKNRGNGLANFYIWDSSQDGWNKKQNIHFDFSPTENPREFILTKHIEKLFFQTATLPVFTDATTAIYPDANPEISTVDGEVYRSLDENWSTKRTGNGSVRDDSSATIIAPYIESSTTSNMWAGLYRGIILFDTSSLGSTTVISSATFSLYGHSKQDNIGIYPDIDIYTSNPVSNTSLTATDYNIASWGSTSLTGNPLSYASFSAAGYNNFNLNSTGINSINKAGISKLGVRNANYDVSGTTPVWSSFKASGFAVKAAETVGISQDPKLTITFIPRQVYYSVGQSASNLISNAPSITITTEGIGTFTEAPSGSIGVGDKVTYNRIDITSIADGGSGTVMVTTSSAHNFQNGDWVGITGTGSGYYDGFYQIFGTTSGGTTFYITHAFSSTSNGYVGNIAFISGKISGTEWRLIDIQGLQPHAVSTKTVYSITRVFTSLSSAIAGASGLMGSADMVTNNYILNLPCYYDTGADTTAVTVNGYTTGANNYIKIYTPNDTAKEANQSQRHAGKWDDTKYRIERALNFSYLMYVEDLYVRVEGLQMKTTGITGFGHGITSASIVGGDVRISNNIIQGLQVLGSCGIVGGNATNFKIWNNIIYSWHDQGISTQGANFYSFNNTIYNCAVGIYGRNGAGTQVAINNIVQNCSDGYNGTIAAGSDYNLSDIAGDTTGISPSYRDGLATDVTFVNEGSSPPDLHLDPSEAEAIAHGKNLSTDSNLKFYDDIDGQRRGNIWDIGADENRIGDTEIQDTHEDNLTSGLVLYQSFDGQHMDWSASSAEARDQSTQGNNGDAVNIDNSNVKIGKLGQALNFNGSDEYVDIANESNFDFDYNQPFSVFNWVKTTIGGLSVRSVFSKINTFTGYELYFYNGQLVATLPSAMLNGISRTTTSTYNDGMWHYVGFTYDGSSLNSGIRIYVDGQEAGSSGASVGTLSSMLNDLTPRVGMRASGGSYFPGTVDEVRVYNRALSQSEITSIYRLGSEKINMSLTNKMSGAGSGLVGMWSFDGANMDWSQASAEARDTSGNNNHGDAVNITKSSVRPGKRGQSLYFNGANNYINMGSPSSLQNIGDNITVSSWFNVQTLDSAYHTIVSKNNETGTGSDSWKMQINTSNQLSFGIRDSSDPNYNANYYHNVYSSTLTVNNWYHVVGTYSGTSLRLYINGVLVDSTTSHSAFLNPTSSSFEVGSVDLTGSPSRFFPGLIDEVRVYNRALSAGEVTNLYRLGSAKLK